METEELFLVIASLLLFFDLIQLLKSKPGEKTKLEYGFYASIVACSLIVVSYFTFLQAFLKDDFSLREVYFYSSSGLPASFKVYATWAGMSGSMLFLTFLVAIAYFAHRFKTHGEEGALRLTLYKILNFLLIFFLLLTLMNSPFERMQGTPMDGKGLNPLLQTFWMFIHPPIVFAAYVFIIFAFALVLAKMKTGEDEGKTVKISLQAAWLLLTGGIAIGGMWAYEVLGWGGYWAWDPVETASLLPWLALTAFFHLGPLSKKGKGMTREFMLLITFSSMLFATSLTRGGLAVSVHAFGASPIGPALLLLALAIIAYFFYLSRETKKPLFELKVEKSSLYSVSFFAAFWSLIFIFLVCFWGVAFPIIAGVFLQNPMATNIDFYNNWNFPFVLAFVAALIGCNVPGRTGFKKFVVLVASSLIVGAALVQIQWPMQNALANLGLPILLVALSVTAFKLIQTLRRKSWSLVSFGRRLLHFAIMITLIGVFFSSTAKQVSGEIFATPNSTISPLGLEVELKNFTVLNATGNVHSLEFQSCVPEYSALRLDVIVKHEGNTYEGALWIRRYTLYGIVSEPWIITTWKGDIYIRMLNTESINDALWQSLIGNKVLPSDLIISVETSSLTYLVWTGVALMSLGIALPIIKGIALLRREQGGPREGL